MTWLFRAMKEGPTGQPLVAPQTRGLGVRPGVDVPANNPLDTVGVGTGGMSVSPDDPANLPYYRRPATFGGTGKDPVWVIDVGDLGPDLIYRADVGSATHGVVEPARPMSLDEYQRALALTQPCWRKVSTWP